MSDNADGENQEQGAGRLASTSPANKETPAKPEIRDQKNGAGNNRERFTKKLEGFSPVFEFAVAAAAVVGVILVIIQIYYLGRSDRAAREALRLTRDNNASSDKTTAALLARMEESNRITREALVVSQRLADEAIRANQLTKERDAAERSRSEAIAARDERFFRTVHRARLGAVVLDKIIEDLNPESVYAFKAVFRNDPASLPAKNVVARTQVETRDPESPFPSVLKFPPPPDGYLAVTSVAPGASQYLTSIWRAESEAEIKDIEDQRKQLFFYGRITYTDQFNTRGALEFCYFYWVPSREWLYCTSHNEEQ